MRKAGRKASPSKRESAKKKTKAEVEAEFLNPAERVRRFEPNVIPLMKKNEYFNWYSYGDTYSEYIVFNAAQVKVRYILQLQ